MAKKDDKGKTIAIISYLTWIGLIIAFVMNSEKKSEFAKYHMRQSLLLNIFWVAGWILISVLAFIPVFGWIISWVFWVFLLVLWIISLIGAVNGEKKETPLIGKLAHDWFKGL